MNNNKSPGPDNIPQKLIKILFSNCSQFFIDLFNYILKMKEIPSKWKIGRMI